MRLIKSFSDGVVPGFSPDAVDYEIDGFRLGEDSIPQVLEYLLES